MTKKLESKELTSAEEVADFWDRNGGQWAASILKTAEAIGMGLIIDEYTDTLKVRFDGTLEPGGQRLVRHNFDESLADPKNWKQ